MNTDSALIQLEEQPWRFEFAQAMRVLLRNSTHGESGLPDDRRFDVANEPVRIAVNQSLAFPASDIQALEKPISGTHAPMSINFLGLTGASGVLPVHYTEFLIDRARAGDDAPADFLDVFNHRLAMLFYFAWEKYRFAVSRERLPGHDLFGRMLLSLVGLGTEHLQNRHSLPDEFFTRYASLLAIQQRSASSLEAILADYFEVPVDIQQFAGNWYQLDENSTTRFREDESDSQRLGYGVVASDEYWSHEFMVRVRIGPLDLNTFGSFLPGGTKLKHLEEICRFFSRDEQVFEVQLILRKDHAPETCLSGNENVGDSRLGWTTWAKSAPFVEDAGDVSIRLS